MTYRHGLITGVFSTALVAGAVGAAWWSVATGPKEATKPAAPGIPATVPKPFKEELAATVVLTADAEAKLAVRTAPLTRRSVRRTRVFGGEVMVPPGRSVVVSAPLAGTLKPGTIPLPGQPVKTGMPVLQLVPILDPVGRANLTAARVESDGLVKTAEEQLKIARITWERAKDVLAGGGGRQRDVDDANAALEVAKQTHRAAAERRDLLARVLGELDGGTTKPIAIDAPADGVIRNVSALPGQTVPAGAPLFEVVNLDVVWVRVPVYVGDREEIAEGAATLRPLTARAGSPGRHAWAIAAPPAANPVAGTVDLFFATLNPDLGDPRWRAVEGMLGGLAVAPFAGTPFSPGQRAAVTLVLNDPAEALAVPWSAVLYDFHGGTWVYVRTAEHTYTRERVVVRHVIDGTAVLDEGPPPGASVVTAGAAELFGTETGFSK